MTNKQIANIFSELASYMELYQENKFKIRSYANAYITLRKTNLSLKDMSIEELQKIDGIGKAIASKILEISEMGSLSLLDEYRAKTPDGIDDLLNLKGLGAQKVLNLWKNYGVQDLYQLREFIQSGNIFKVKGFGKKTVEKLSENIDLYENSKGRVLYADAEKIAFQIYSLVHEDNDDKSITQFLETIDETTVVGKLCFVGQFLLRKDIIDLLELIVLEDDATLIEDSLSHSVEFNVNEKGTSSIDFIHSSGLNIHFKFVSTFSDEIIYQNTHPHFANNSIGHHSKNVEVLHQYFQHEIYYPDADIIIGSGKMNTDSLISQADIKGVIHTHTTYSDGVNSLEEMVEAAYQKGYEYILITDHSKAAFYANGLDEDRLLKQMNEIDKLNKKYSDFRILKGIECDILSNGDMDLSDEILHSLDVVIASIHSTLNMSEERAMKRLLKAIEHPGVDILGHLTGRLLLSRNGYPVNHAKIIEACAKNNTSIEINANPKRLDIDSQYVQMCQENGVKISINPDAHSIRGIDDIRYGVIAGRRGGLKKDNCINSYGVEAFMSCFS